MHSTFSIVARSTEGLLGVALATMLPAAGSVCPRLRHGVGAVCTQAWTNPGLAPVILDSLAAGHAPEAALAQALSTDPEPGARQLGVVAADGRAAAHSGETIEPWGGHLLAPGLALQGNFLVGAQTLKAMRTAFAETETAASGDIYACAVALGTRLVAALEAGEATGGDWRGNRSAAVQVVGPLDFPLVDLRVDEHRQAVAELRRLFELSRRDWFPFLRALPTPAQPAGNWGDLRRRLKRKVDEAPPG